MTTAQEYDEAMAECKEYRKAMDTMDAMTDQMINQIAQIRQALTKSNADFFESKVKDIIATAEELLDYSYEPESQRALNREQ